MSDVPIYIAGRGVISPIGCNVTETIESLSKGTCGLVPLTLFQTLQEQQPIVGQVRFSETAPDTPRTHQLARRAAEQALGDGPTPDAIVLGSTTGGILTTEALLESGVRDPEAYRYHGLATVTDDLARFCGCVGPAIAVSTACSSGAVAIKLAMQMLRTGRARRVLAGGVDALCRLTYFGFKSLQLVDASGARPFDAQRRGMSVAEGAAFLLLTTDPPSTAAPRLLGAGLSCDAYHATTPHPEGLGALAAMQAALADAGIDPQAIDYINLHGTGTIDNDSAEAKAVQTLFGMTPPLLSSTKGATGHTLAAAGAIEAVIGVESITHGVIPANVGLRRVDPELSLAPVTAPLHQPVRTILSNSFGFGGNNAALIIADPPGNQTSGQISGQTSPQTAVFPTVPLAIKDYACITGVGHTRDTMDAFFQAAPCTGCLGHAQLSQGLSPRMVRRLKRLPIMALALAKGACDPLGQADQPSAVCLGTGWGALSETYDFLQRLFETQQAFPSPTDFIGSVHNAPAGQIAMLLGARGANVTVSGGDYSFEQALLAATLTAEHSRDTILVIGADEHHCELSPLFDPCVGLSPTPSDGGGAVVLQRSTQGAGPSLAFIDYRFHQFDQGEGAEQAVKPLIDRLGGVSQLDKRFGAVMAGIPAAHAGQAGAQLSTFIQYSGFKGPVVDYRRWVGQFASASAVAVVLAIDIVKKGVVPGALCNCADVPLKGKGILVLGLGPCLTAVGVYP